MNMRRKRNKKIFRLLISIAVISSLSLSLSGCRNNMEHAKSETAVPSDIQSVQSSEDKSDSDTSPLLDSASAAPETPTHRQLRHSQIQKMFPLLPLCV